MKLLLLGWRYGLYILEQGPHLKGPTRRMRVLNEGIENLLAWRPN